MEERKYTKLSELVGSEFTIQKDNGYKWKMWDNGTKKMIAQDEWFSGARKVYTFDTDKGTLYLSESQLGQLLSKVYYNGSAVIDNATFEVGSNGKTGMEIRYWFNVKKSSQVSSQTATETISQTNETSEPHTAPDQPKSDEPNFMDNDINLDDIPF